MPQKATNLNGVGQKAHAEIVRIYAAVTNSDTTEGRGRDVDHSYYATAEGALLGSIGIGVMGNDGKVEERLAIKFSDPPRYYVIDPKGPVSLVNETKLREDVRKKALSKLTPAEREAVGIKP